MRTDQKHTNSSIGKILVLVWYDNLAEMETECSEGSV